MFPGLLSVAVWFVSVLCFFPFPPQPFLLGFRLRRILPCNAAFQIGQQVMPGCGKLIPD